MAHKSDYGNESISALKGSDRVRKRPGVIFGSDDLEGCIHSIFEILSNSIDEAREGYGNKIIVTRFKDGSLQVEDFGRGIPLDYNSKEGRYNWELVYCELYAGAKYNNNSAGDYEYSLGLNGLGACATQYSSEYFDVIVYRDKTKYSLHFQKGEVIGDVDKALVKEAYRFNRTGTIQHWKPDSDVFTDTDIPIERLRDILEKQSVVNGGIEFVLIDDVLKTEESYLCPEGILGFCKKLSSDKGLTLPFLIQGSGKGRDADDRPVYNVKSQIAFAFNNDVNVLQYFHNSSYLEHGGSPENAVKNAFVYIIDKEIKARDKYKAKENKVKFDDIKESLILITNTFSTQTSYANQTKKAINNKFIQDFMTDLIKSNLEIWFIENRALGDKVIDQILLNKRSRENAEKNRSKFIDELNNKKTNDISNKIKKFRDCKSKDTSIRELYIVEGDSAMGSIIQARDSEFQAVMPIRGKILNCLKASYSKILESDIIIDLIKVLGCGVELQNKHSKDLSAFHLERLQWNKIIICTDADVDGFQIRTLLAAMIYRLAPTLIEKGFVYIAESPLFEITAKGKGKDAKEETFFAYSDKEKADIVRNFEGKILSIQRSKGLGENTPLMMSKTTMNPKSRRLIRVTPDDAKKTAEIFELLLGDNLEGRKRHIEEDGHLYLDMLDLS